MGVDKRKPGSRAGRQQFFSSHRVSVVLQVAALETDGRLIADGYQQRLRRLKLGTGVRLEGQKDGGGKKNSL